MHSLNKPPTLRKEPASLHMGNSTAYTTYVVSTRYYILTMLNWRGYVKQSLIIHE